MLSGLFRISSKRLDSAPSVENQMAKANAKGHIENGSTSPKG